MKYKQAGAGEEKNIRERDWVLNVWERKTESSWEVYDKTRGIIDEDQKNSSFHSFEKLSYSMGFSKASVMYLHYT